MGRRKQHCPKRSSEEEIMKAANDQQEGSSPGGQNGPPQMPPGISGDQNTLSLAARWIQLQAQFALRWQHQQTEEKHDEIKNNPGLMSIASLMMAESSSPGPMGAWQKLLAAQRAMPPGAAGTPVNQRFPPAGASPFPVLGLPNAYSSSGIKATRWPTVPR